MEESITQILERVRRGDKAAESRLVAFVYNELYAIARRLMHNERADHTLQPTALVNEALLRLLGQTECNWKDRAHFCAVAAEVMRHVLVDYARERSARKRGAGAALLPLDEVLVISPNRLEDLLILDDALERLGTKDPRALRVIVYRFYGGLTVEQVAEIMRISTRSVVRDWNYGRAWLKAELGPKARYVARPADQN